MSKIITIGRGKFRGRTNRTLQLAVDEIAAKGGGTVEIPSGVYMMHDALHLRARVRVRGEKGAVLRKVPSVTSRLAGYLGYGLHEFTVAEPALFRVGMGVFIADKNAFGFYTTVATIVGRKKNRFYINRPLAHDYHPGPDGRVTSVFPLIAGYSVRNVSVENVALDGNPAETCPLNGCRGGGVFLLGVHQAHLENIEVLHYRGDAISFQQCTDVMVRNCHLHDNHGSGVHPGSGSVRYLISGNRVQRNTGYGVFYCLRTTHSVCEENILEDNREAGISLGEHDTDHHIRNNVIQDHDDGGIVFRKPLIHGADRIRIEGNTIRKNCRRRGQHEIVIPERLNDILIAANRIEPSAAGAVLVGPGCGRICFAGNQVGGRPQAPGDIEGEAALVSRITPGKFPPVGPAAAPSDAATHLAIGRLPPWKG